MFKIGDYVKIVDGGALYSSYAEMARILGATRWRSGRYSGDYRQLKNKIGKIMNINTHPRYNDTHVLLLEINGIEILIGSEGVVKIDNQNKKKYGIVNFCEKYYV